MSLFTLLDQASKGVSILDKFVTTKQEKAEFELELAKLTQDYHLEQRKLSSAENIAQIKLNQQEAKSRSFFIAGWRPALGWIALGAFAYSSLIYPLLGGVIPGLSQLDLEVLLNVLLGMLGLGSLRTVEKIKGVHNQH